MTEHEDLPRRYVDSEVSRILERAADLQLEEGAGGTGADGLTLRDLEQIGAEVGIDPRHLRRAAAEMVPGGSRPSRWTWFTGGPTTLRLERTVPGEVPDTAFEVIIEEIRRSAGSPGQPSLLGRTLTWRSEGPSQATSVEVTVTSRGGQTSIRIEERLHGLAGALFGGIMGGVGGGVGFGVGMGVGIGALGSALFAVTFPAAAISASYLTARGVFSNAVSRRRTALYELLEQTSAAVAGAVKAPALGDGAAPISDRGDGRAKEALHRSGPP